MGDWILAVLPALFRGRAGRETRSAAAWRGAGRLRRNRVVVSRPRGSRRAVEWIGPVASGAAGVRRTRMVANDPQGIVSAICASEIHLTLPDHNLLCAKKPLGGFFCSWGQTAALARGIAANSAYSCSRYPRTAKTHWPYPSASRTAVASSASRSRCGCSNAWEMAGRVQKLNGIRKRRIPPMFLAPTESDIGSSPSCGTSNNFSRSSRFVSASH